jgi:predicted RNA-binding protein YlqC (UPF0109 family)
VDQPDEVSVEEFEEGDGAILLELAVAPEDYGKVIGRSGRTVQALRTVVAAAGRASQGDERRRVLIDVVE